MRVILLAALLAGCVPAGHVRQHRQELAIDREQNRLIEVLDRRLSNIEKRTAIMEDAGGFEPVRVVYRNGKAYCQDVQGREWASEGQCD